MKQPDRDEALARFAAIVETSPDAIISKTLDGIVTTWNGGARRLLGYEAEEMIGQSITRIIPPELLSEEDDILARLRRGERVEYYETERVRKDGQRLQVSLSISTFRDREGKLIGAAKIARDITERKRYEKALQEAKQELEANTERLEKTVAERTAQLRQSVSELEAFAYSLSHDMRTPLRSIRGFTKAVLEDCAGRLDETSVDYLQRVTVACDHLEQLIRDVLQFTRIAHEEMPIREIDIEKTLKMLIADRAELQFPRAVVRIEKPLGRIRGHETSLVQCLANLLGNAVKFVGPGVTPEVKVWSESRGSRVRLWIEDNGIGIPAKHQERVFRLFERYHKGGSYEGTGLGLAIVKRAAERMGGAVGVESTPGVGSRFWLELPAARMEQVRVSQPAIV